MNILPIIQRAIARLWFWLTTPVICCGCHKVKHRAILRFLGDGLASHGFCVRREQRFIADLHEIERGNTLTPTPK